MAETQERGELLSDSQEKEEEAEGPVVASPEMGSILAVTAATSLRSKYDFSMVTISLQYGR